MKKLLLLLKIYLLQFAGINDTLHGHDRAKRNKAIVTLVAFCLIGLMMLGMSYGFFLGMCMGLNALGAPGLTLVIACAAASLVAIVTTVFKVAPTLFAFKDFDLVMSLPIDVRTVVMSRVFRLYGANLFFTAFVMLPAAVAYLVFEPQGVLFHLLFVLTFLFVPLIPIAIASVVGTLISMVSMGFRHKNLVTIVLSLLLLVGYMSATMSFGRPRIKAPRPWRHCWLISVRRQHGHFACVPPAEWYASGLQGDVGKALLFVGVSTALFALFVVAAAKGFNRLNTRLSGSGPARRGAVRDQKSAAPLMALYIKEIRRYFASPLYVLNTGIGAVLLILAAVGLLVSGEEALAVSLEMSNLPEILGKAAPFVISLFVCMSGTTASSISIEGNKLWQLKALPLPVADIFLAKLLVSFTVMAPAILIAGTIFNIVLGTDIAGALLVYLVPLLYMAFIACFGLYMNLLFPKFDWKSETEVIKQGTPMLASIFGGLAISALPVAMLVGFGVADVTLVTTGIAVVVGVAAWLVWRLI
jgi:ABC-2 type transport system permease protein